LIESPNDDLKKTILGLFRILFYLNFTKTDSNGKKCQKKSGRAIFRKEHLSFLPKTQKQVQIFKENKNLQRIS
jgi:hypothetical protein